MAVVRLRPADLRSALASDGTSLQYQVQVHVPSGTLAGVEAFVRWPHPLYGMVGPAEIVQLVIQGGLHVEFDAWVIRTASAQAKQWIAKGVPLPLIAVNIWDQTLRSLQLPELVGGAEHLELELPRGAATDPAHVSMIGSVRARGARVAADTLPEIDVDTVKLRHPVDAPTVSAARERGVRVVAEGIESEDQKAQALAAGCEIVQGYVFGPEVSASEVSALARPPA